MKSRDATATESTVDENEAIAFQFVRARLDAIALTSYPGSVPRDISAAYRIQHAAIRHWPDRIAGWKVARIPAQWRTQYDEERLIGPAFSANVRFAQPGEIIECPVFENGLAAVEAELVIRLGTDAAADQIEWQPHEAMALIEAMYIGVEIASSPLATLNDLGSGAVISDFGNNWGVIVGAAIPDWRGLYEVAAETRIDGNSVGRGSTPILDGPLGALLFTLNKCAQHGHRLRAGDVISTGMITGVHDIRIGQQSQHVFAGYGDLTCRIVPALPYSLRE